MRIRQVVVASCALTLSNCAFPTQVQRFGVEYNEALASMANEQTLLNILRASKGMPTHFTSVSRFTGTLSMKASGGLNGQLRGSGLTSTTSAGTSLSTATTRGTSVAPGGTTTSDSVLTTPGSAGSLMNVVAEGVDLYTPQVAGELSSGTAFDVQVFDQQKFYQGILGAVPFSTVEMLINQGFEADLVANLLIARVDFYLKDTKTGGKQDGDAIASYRNDATDRARFQNLIDCNALDVGEARAPATKIAPISRLDLGTAAGRDRLTLAQLALFDGDKFALSDPEGISPDGSTDPGVYVVKPGAKSRIPRLVKRSCPSPAAQLSPEGVYMNDGTALHGEMVGGVMTPVPRPVIMEIVFRSPEAVLRAVGEIVRLGASPSAPRVGVCADGSPLCVAAAKRYEPVFELVSGRARNPLLTARFMHEDYSVLDGSLRSMQVVSIIQQLVNLQKESSERALSVPVRAVP